MKRKLIFLIICSLYEFSYGKIVDEKDLTQFSVYYNTDSSANIYFVDTISPSQVKLILKDEYQNCFALTDTLGLNDVTSVLKYNNAYVLLVGGSDFGQFIFDIPYIHEPEMWNVANFEHNKILSVRGKEYKIGGERLYRAYYENAPSIYIFALIKGWVYNYATCHSIIHEYVENSEVPYERPLDFCNENAYYRMLIPVWNDF